MAEPARDEAPAPRRSPLFTYCRRRTRRLAWAAGALALCLAAAGSVLRTPAPLLLWNASASTTPGLYIVVPAAHLRAGDIAVAWPPRHAREVAAARSYLPAAVPLVKPVAAIAGDRVCAAGDRVFVGGRLVALRRARDPSGRPMRWWSGCRVLRPGEIFLLSAGVPLAFDGRYFGVTRAREIVGRARLLWAR